MNHNRKFLILLCLCVLIVFLVACEPTPPGPVYPAQREGTVHIEGDSVTWNTYWDTGVDYTFTSGQWLPGSRIDLSPWNGHPALERLPDDLAAGNVDKLVWALGLNEISSQKAWSIQHQLMWHDMLGNHVPEETCIVIVKPWVLPADHAYRPLEAINSLRTWIDNFASIHPNVRLVDWKPILEANPNFAATDGVHLDPGTGAAEARDAMYREGLSRCA